MQKDHLKDCGDNDLSFNVDGASVLDEFVKSDVKDGLTVRMHALLLRIMVGATFRKLQFSSCSSIFISSLHHNLVIIRSTQACDEINSKLNCIIRFDGAFLKYIFKDNF